MENEFVKKQEEVSEQQETRTSEKKKGRNLPAFSIAELLNGEILTKQFVVANLNFIFFIIFLSLLIVGKGYYGKQLAKEIDTAQKDVDEATAEYVEAKARLEETVKRQVLVEKLESRGLRETINPAKVIRIKEKK